MVITNEKQLQQVVQRELSRVEITDIHTHLFSQDFGELFLWGIDEILTYHYLVSEYFRYSELAYDNFFSLPKERQAEEIWQKLFIENSPLSESARGVLTILNRLGADVAAMDLDAIREHFNGQDFSKYVDEVFRLSGVKEVVMTNDPFDPREKRIWDTVGNNDPRFKAALRIDPLLNEYEKSHLVLQEQGYKVNPELDEQTLEEIRRFLKDWTLRIDALYLAVSLPADFVMPEDSVRATLIEKCVLPVCYKLNRPLAMMIGVKRSVNPKLRLAGDSLGKSEIGSVEYLCAKYPDNKFLITMLARENQHELAITARKFRNMMVFGCWWFMNNPSIIQEITRMRVETLGLSFIPQHSDARVFEHIIYKWEHTKEILLDVLVEKYGEALANKWALSEAAIARDIKGLFGQNFWTFLER